MWTYIASSSYLVLEIQEFGAISRYHGRIRTHDTNVLGVVLLPEKGRCVFPIHDVISRLSLERPLGDPLVRKDPWKEMGLKDASRIATS